MAVQQLIPIDFSLLNLANQESSLFTMGQGEKGQSLQLSILNQSRGNIQFASAGTKASPQHYHFALCFSPGLLTNLEGIDFQAAMHSSKQKKTTPLNGWVDVVYAPDHAHYDCFYLLFTENQLHLSADDSADRLIFEITGITVDSSIGSRYSSVVLRSRNLIIGNEIPLPDATRRKTLPVYNSFPRISLIWKTSEVLEDFGRR